MLWRHWWNLVCDLRSACARTRTFLWMSLCLAGISTRKDLLGVTSIVRALGLAPACYDRLLDFFHSPALDLNKLTRAWCALVFRFNSGILRVNLKPVLVGDGIKVAKAGRKMPGVKKLHQESDSNTKPEYIFGHSCQAVAVLTQALSSVFALPLACRIHEGTVIVPGDAGIRRDQADSVAGAQSESNALADRWVRSVKQECLSKLILFGEPSLRRALGEFVEHFHVERNHQGKGNVLLFPSNDASHSQRRRSVCCRERLGGLLKYSPGCRMSILALRHVLCAA